MRLFRLTDGEFSTAEGVSARGRFFRDEDGLVYLLTSKELEGMVGRGKFNPAAGFPEYEARGA
jgi:hypothetical protein